MMMTFLSDVIEYMQLVTYSEDGWKEEKNSVVELLSILDIVFTRIRYIWGRLGQLSQPR